jgi:hypothetical protein
MDSPHSFDTDFDHERFGAWSLRREEHGERYWKWALNLLLWDGMLPVAVLAIPQVVSLLHNQRLSELTFLFVPVVAFVIRYLHGMRRFRRRVMRIWQLPVFFVAIFVLFVLDSLLVLCSLIKDAPPAGFWWLCLAIYLAYLGMMAIAFFPRQAGTQTETTQLGIAY